MAVAAKAAKASAPSEQHAEANRLSRAAQIDGTTKPAHPRRIWVQLATGRDVSALGFDWRRLSRRAPDLLGKFDPHVTPWGRVNRLLAGPIANSREARRLVNALSDKGIDTFTYTSPEGTEIKELK